MSKKDNKDDTKSRIIDAYASIVDSGIKFPTRSDLYDVGINRDLIRHYFTNIKGLRDAAKEKHPDLFSGVVEERSLTSDAYLKDLHKEVKKYKRFVISTAVNGQELHQEFLHSIEKYCATNNASLLLIPSSDPAHNLDNQVEWHFDEKLLNYKIIFSELFLNSNIQISAIRINAKQVNPHTGLGRMVQSEGSAIFGSPKQNLDYIAVSSTKYPHALMSTGAITKPNYKTSSGNSLRSAFIAEYDHVIGAIIVEIVDDKLYHFRQIQSDKDGSFIDLGLKYSKNKITKVDDVTLVMGDYHSGEHDEDTKRGLNELTDMLKVNRIFMHDFFDGSSISHHEKDRIVTRAKKAAEGLLSLKNELSIVSDELNFWSSKKFVKEIVMIKSNHDEFLDRWCDDGRFVRDALNFQLGCQISDKMVDGKDALKSGLELVGDLQYALKIKWLDRDEDYKIAGIECGAHGDKGPNGSRGSRANLENAYGSAVIGHSHTPGILRGIWQVGTTSKLKQDYNKGPSSWMNTSCLVYPNGQRQLINFIEGEWKLKK